MKRDSATARYSLCLSLALCLFPSLSSNSFAQESSFKDKALSFHFEPSPDYLPTSSKLNIANQTELAQIRKQFATPGTDFASAPLWVWNDLLTEDQIRSTLTDLNKQNVNMAFVHPRPGLATPYLSEDWFKLWDAALDEADKRDMKIWIYDENSYPSGFAGGFVPEALPESRGAGLDVVFLDDLVDANNNWLAGASVVYVIEQLNDGTTIDRSSEILDAHNAGKPIPGKSANGQNWIVGRIQLAGHSQWFGGKTYVNLMEKGVLDAFLGFTHEAYRQHFEERFGKKIPGAFTDEPQVMSAGMFSWCSDFPQQFQNRRGYDLIPHIGSLIQPVGDWKKVRYDYFKTVLEVFIERWHKPFAEYCESVGLEYTGHDWEHEWPRAHACPDNMATAFWRQRPAIDLLMNNFARDTHAQFGNVRSVRELNSATRQAGRSRSISENYGAGGYDIKFEDLKRLGDWSYALGVNTTDEHLSYISIRGARKHDHPQTFSYHSPWFEQYSKLEDYWTRLSYVLSRGALSNDRFLLIEPTSTAWLYQNESGPENANKCEIVGAKFANLLNQLEAEQLDYDLGSEDIICRVGDVKGSEFVVGAASYKTVVLCDATENLDSKTIVLLSKFLANGGQVISLNAPLTLVDGAEVDTLPTDVKEAFDVVKAQMTTQTLDEAIASQLSAQQLKIVADSNKDNVFHQLRETKDALILFLCNIDLKDSASGSITLQDARFTGAVEVFDPLTGKIQNYARKNADGSLSFDLTPCGSIVLVFSNAENNASEVTNVQNVRKLDPWTLSNALVKVAPCDDNVLVLDYMTVKLADETLENEYFYRANNWFWNKKGYPMSPWDNGVQFKDELITKKFDDKSGFEVLYKFTKSDATISNLRFVVENPSMFKVYCNDRPLDAIPDAWKFDRDFGVFDISKVAKQGENVIKLVADKATLFTELMPAWIVGDFTLENAEQGFKIVANKGLKFQTAKEELVPRASSALEGVSWLSSGVNFSGNDDRAPFIALQVREATNIKALRIWNYCEANLAKRGVKTFELNVLDENGVVKTQPNLPMTLELAKGNTFAQTLEFGQELSLDANDKVVLTIKSNWNGISYPLADDFAGTTRPENDNAFVGLAEVQLLNADLQPLEVAVSASSELVFRIHDRRASYAVDGSGLSVANPGWAAQGYPFYAGAVDYDFVLKTADLANEEQVLVELPERSRWEAAVVAILVDGAQVGAIGWQGESVNITSVIQNAVKANNAEVKLTFRVYGTPKNLFGPHHAGQLRGSAWPGSFHGAPAQQPSGSDYDVIEYGLF